MTPDDTLQRRMAALFLLAAGLIAWQAPRTHPAEIPPLLAATQEGEQLFPVAVPEGDPLALPADPSARKEFLRLHAVPWGLAGTPGECTLYLRVSAQHWAMRPIPRARLPGSTEALRLTAGDFADDDDGDGDRLDAGELRNVPTGAEVEVFCAP